MDTEVSMDNLGPESTKRNPLVASPNLDSLQISLNPGNPCTYPEAVTTIALSFSIPLASFSTSASTVSVDGSSVRRL
jgi:hypothetical protein